MATPAAEADMKLSFPQHYRSSELARCGVSKLRACSQGSGHQLVAIFLCKHISCQPALRINVAWLGTWPTSASDSTADATSRLPPEGM